MRLMFAMLMAGLLLTLPASAQGMRGRRGPQASSFVSGSGNCPKGGRTCDGTGPKRQGHGQGQGQCQGNGNCPRGQGCPRGPAAK